MATKTISRGGRPLSKPLDVTTCKCGRPTFVPSTGGHRRCQSCEYSTRYCVCTYVGKKARR